MNYLTVIALGAMTFSIGSCASAGVAKTKPIDLTVAISKIQDAIVQTRRVGGDKAGLIVGKATAVLALVSENTNGSDIKVALPVGVAAWSAGASHSSHESTTNTLTIEFNNPDLAPTNSVIGAAIERCQPIPKNLDAVVADVTTHSLKPAPTFPIKSLDDLAKQGESKSQGGPEPKGESAAPCIPQSPQNEGQGESKS